MMRIQFTVPRSMFLLCSERQEPSDQGNEEMKQQKDSPLCSPTDSTLEVIADEQGKIESLDEESIDKHQCFSTDMLWQQKLYDFEKKCEARAQVIARQWQQDRKNLEQIIDENLSENQDLYEKATAFRIQFEHEKARWESVMRTKTINPFASTGLQHDHDRYRCGEAEERTIWRQYTSAERHRDVEYQDWYMMLGSKGDDPRERKLNALNNRMENKATSFEYNSEAGSRDYDTEGRLEAREDNKDGNKENIASNNNISTGNTKKMDLIQEVGNVVLPDTSPTAAAGGDKFSIVLPKKRKFSCPQLVAREVDQRKRIEAGRRQPGSK